MTRGDAGQNISKFARTSEIVKTMFALINQTEEQINELWEKALTL